MRDENPNAEQDYCAAKASTSLDDLAFEVRRRVARANRIATEVEILSGLAADARARLNEATDARRAAEAALGSRLTDLVG